VENRTPQIGEAVIPCDGSNLGANQPYRNRGK
jgi:hypothetical protein